MMKKLLLTSTLSAIILAVGFYWNSNNTDQSQAKYVPNYKFGTGSLGQTYSGAEAYYKMIRSSVVTGEVEESDLLIASRFASTARDRAQLSRAQNYAWIEDGPQNLGGRTRAIEVDPNNQDVLWAGSVSGGLFISYNKGNNWERVKSFDSEGTNIVSTIEVLSNGYIYVGTGSTFELTISGGYEESRFYGGGLFVSKDNGVSWSRIDDASPSNPFSGVSFSVINKILKTKDESKLMVASNLGVQFLDVASETLSSVPGLPATGTGQSIVNSADGNDYVVAVKVSLSRTSFFKSTDGGLNYNEIHEETSSGRTELAIAPSDKNYIYAIVTTTSGALKNLIRSTDGGSTWSVLENGLGGDIDRDPFSIEYFGSKVSQGIYDLAITVSPSDKNRAIVGGMDLFHYNNGTWEKIAIQGSGLTPNPFVVHADVHSFVWNDNGDLYIGTDGGIYMSNDEAGTFAAYNRGYVTTQFFGIAAKGDVALGGTQDNGSLLLDRQLYDPRDAVEVLGGDGFTSEISRYSTDYRVVTSQFGAIGRSVKNVSDLFPAVLFNQGAYGPFNTQVRLFEDDNDVDSKDSVEYTLVTEDTLYAGEVITFNGKMGIYEQSYTLPHDLVYSSEFSTIKEYIWVDTSRSLGGTPVYDTTLANPNTIVTFNPLTDSVLISADTIRDTLSDGNGGIDTVIVSYIEADTLFAIVDTLFDTVQFVPSVKIGTTLVYDTIAVSPDSSILFDSIITVTNIPLRKDTIKIQDKVQSILAFGVGDYQGAELGIKVTRDVFNLNTNGSSVEWIDIDSKNLPSEVTTMEWSITGDALFVGFKDGSIYRYSGLDSVYTTADAGKVTETQIAKLNTVVTSISVDRNNAERLIVTNGGTSTGHIYELTNVISAINMGAVTKVSIDHNLSGALPVYASVVDKFTDNIIVGTEYGLYVLENGETNWEYQSSFEKVPVFDLRQNHYSWDEGGRNIGRIWVGSHGRGIWYTDDNHTSIDELDEIDGVENSLLDVYPNPASSSTVVKFSSNTKSDAVVRVYSITGSLVLEHTLEVEIGNNEYTVNVNTLPTGTYVVNLKTSSGINKSAKLMVK